MADKNFIKVKEDFVCGHCGVEVKGSGYTNHCPKCLWSKHVDINPGDRAENCGGLMEPIEIEFLAGGFDLVHQCKKCGAVKKNKADENDDAEALIALSGEI